MALNIRALQIKKTLRSFLFIFLLSILFPAGLSLGAVTDPECFDCHDKYKSFSHSDLHCTECHYDVTALPHGEKLAKPDCSICHRKKANLFKESLHGGQGMACKACHDVHFLQKDKKSCPSCHGKVPHKDLPSAKRHLTNLTCMACHGKVDRTALIVRVELKQGRGLKAALIDRNNDGFISIAEWHALEDLLRTEVKGSHTMGAIYETNGEAHSVAAKSTGCFSCHSRGDYLSPARLQVTGALPFEAPMDSRVVIPELPDPEQFIFTVHGKAGLACTDCHQAGMEKGGSRFQMSGVCIKCHQEIGRVYGQSVHGRKNAAHCTDCHNPHHMKPYKELRADERVAVCSRCHKDYLRKHSWLPNTVLHFDYLECATCHSPKSQKSMVFRLARRSGGGKTPLSYDDLMRLYGKNPFDFLKAEKDSPDTHIGLLFTSLTQKEPNLMIDASIIVTKAHHDYSEKVLKEKQCVSCHSREAKFYSSMYFAFPNKTGVDYLTVKGSLLSTYPVAASIDLFLLGETKLKKNDLFSFFQPKTWKGLGLKLIDLCGLFLVLLIWGGISLHALLRMVVKR